MNCANHPDISAVAYCRTCGKPLCANCTRAVRGVIYCENCLATRLEGVLPPAAPGPPLSGTPGPAPLPGSGPNPALAGILAGFFPVGVGAVYTGQYAKGLAHLVIFAFLIYALEHGGAWDALFGIAMGFFYFYQIIDAVRSAKAIQMGQPVPDPFGLGQTFGGGERMEPAKVPTGAVVLIALGVLFLLHTLGMMEFGFERYWPLILIFLGAWLFARHWGLLGQTSTAYDCDRCRTRRIFGPVILFTLGVLFLLQNLNVVDLGRTWPVILLVIGVVKLVQSNASTAGHREGPPPMQGGSGPTGVVTGEVQPPPSEVRNV